MFTGIVREVGRVIEVGAGEAGATLRIAAPETAARTAVGDSVAIGGVCLTAESVDGETMRFQAVPETLGRSTLGGLQAGDAVNVEPALRAGEPLGGHIVQGHVDGLGFVRAIEQEGDGVRMSFDVPPELLAYLVEKGSVTVDGVSLTVAALEDDVFAVALIPHTLSVTTLGALAPGAQVNLEVDVLAKYVERLVAPRLR